MARRDAESWGRRAESMAAAWLRLKGYRVLARRVRTPVGEIDLVIRRGRTLAFVEVKARASFEAAADSLGYRARKRIARAANMLLARFGDGCESIRIDAVLVAPWRLPRHLVGVLDGEWP